MSEVSRSHEGRAPSEGAMWSCSHCGPHPKSRQNWCEKGCGSDYSQMTLVEGRSDLPPEGRDERVEALIADAVMKYAAREWVEKHRRVSGPDFDAGYRAALVESEARERELEKRRRESRAQRSRRKAAEARAEKAEAALRAVLQRFIDRDELEVRGWDLTALDRAEALVGVIEAEPDGSKR